MGIRFTFSETKAVQCLAYIASLSPGLTPLYVSKIMYFAEKWHLNKYARPIAADTFIAMPKGPVPSNIKDFIDANWNWVEKPEELDAAVHFDRSRGWPKMMAGDRGPDLSVLSKSDVECIQNAIEYCVSKSAAELSRITHLDPAWHETPLNNPMDYAKFVDADNPNRDEVLSLLEENAACGVL